MAALVVQEFPEGVTPVPVFTTNPGTSNTMPNDGRTQLYVRNNEGTPVICTATAPGKCSHGFLHNRVDSVPANDEVQLLPYHPTQRFNNPATGLVAITLDRSSADIALAAVRVFPQIQT